MKNTMKLKFPNEGSEFKLIIEAGHIYANESPGLEHKLGAEWGSFLSQYLKVFGATVDKWLFIDDYNPSYEDKPLVLDQPSYLAMLTSLGFKPDNIIYETAMVEKAKDALSYLIDQDYTSVQNDGSIILQKDRILLYNPENEKYMCSLLDACLYMEKMKHADICMTVLESQYIPQQKGTLTILKKLGVDTDKITPFFYLEPSSDKHISSSPENVFLRSNNHGHVVKPAIEMLHLMIKISGNDNPHFVKVPDKEMIEVYNAT